MDAPLPLPTPQQLVTLRALLVPLSRVSALFVVLGLIACVTAFVNAIFNFGTGLVGWIPFVGRIVSAPLHSIQRHITDRLGKWEVGIDASMGGFFHALTIAVNQLATGEAEAAWATMLTAKAVGALHSAVRALPSTGSVVTKTTTVIKRVNVITTKVVHVGTIAAHAAPGALVRTVGAIAGEVEHVIEWDIPKLRARTKALEGRLGRLAHTIRANAKPLVGAAFTAALVAALARLGASWIKCNPFKQNAKALCGSHPGWWEDLLAGAVLIAGTVSVVEFVRETQAVETAAMESLASFVREFPKV